MRGGWSPLPRGHFTGIDWSAHDAARGWDPYLVWADCVGITARAPAAAPWWRVVLQTHEGISIEKLAKAGAPHGLSVPAVYTSHSAPRGLRYCTARAGAGFFRALQPGGALHLLVRRVELAGTGPAEHDAQPAPSAPSAPSARSAPSRAGAPERPLTGAVFGLIDDSLALANTCFLGADGEPRTRWFWRQDGQGPGRAPPELAYGHELEAGDIRLAMERHRHGGLVDEGAVYTALGFSALGRDWPLGKVPFHALDRAASHGSHVADLACGPRLAASRIANCPPDFDAPPSWALAGDEASRCPIVAVQLDHATVEDTSGGSLHAHVLDGLLYILARCDAGARVVVNISFGALAGPHDGSSLLEQAMDQLLALRAGRLHIVLAAGNSYQLRTHVNVRLAPGGSEALHWRVQPDDRTPSFLELWIQEGCTDIGIELTPPGAARPLPALQPGQSGLWRHGDGQPVCALVYPSRVATGAHGTCALLALVPTFSFDAGVAVAPSGVWTVRLRNQGSQAAVVDGYIERDDVVAGSRRGARQSRFEDAPELPWDQQYDVDARTDDPGRATPIRRGGSFNSIATGRSTLSAGGRRLSDDGWAAYSPRDPDPDRGRPQRPGVSSIPDGAAPSDENPCLPGLNGAGSRSGGATRLAGTSAAAPQLARRLLNAAATSAPEASS